MLGGIGLYAYFASTLPRLPDFDRYRLEAAESTRVRAWDGTDLAELASERREILPLEAFPKTLLQAFVAIEDRRFYEHHGIDFEGLAQAFGTSAAASESEQAGSTIREPGAERGSRGNGARGRVSEHREVVEQVLAARGRVLLAVGERLNPRGHVLA